MNDDKAKAAYHGSDDEPNEKTFDATYAERWEEAEEDFETLKKKFSKEEGLTKQINRMIAKRKEFEEYVLGRNAGTPREETEEPKAKTLSGGDKFLANLAGYLTVLAVAIAVVALGAVVVNPALEIVGIYSTFLDRARALLGLLATLVVFLFFFEEGIGFAGDVRSRVLRNRWRSKK